MISAYGCKTVSTPNIDRIINGGYSYWNSYSTNPVCSPARSSLFTGRMTVETGVITNNQPITPGMPNMGDWFQKSGYQTFYSGKWHLWRNYPSIDKHMSGFKVIPAGNAQGDFEDEIVAQSCDAFLRNYDSSDPFLYVASLLQPHDCCYWFIQPNQLIPRNHEIKEMDFINQQFPDLPPNIDVKPNPETDPAEMLKYRKLKWTKLQWKYFTYVYQRQIEMLDADIGRILDGLEESGRIDDTILVFTSDHGEQAGRHGMTGKWTPYEESAKVPLVFFAPNRIPAGTIDRKHLVNGNDIMSTFCDYANIAPPPHARGHSLKPHFDGDTPPWREFVVGELRDNKGRFIRTDRYKYTSFEGDPKKILYDLQEDFWEVNNLANNDSHADIVKDHQKLLDDWEKHMIPAEPTPIYAGGKPRKKKKN